MPNDTDPFLPDTDACDVSIGAVLSQVQNGLERVIAYASRSLSKLERNYCVTRKELLAIVCYTKTFRQYLLGRQFVVRTDHSALQWLRTTPELIGQQARWCEILEEFDFQIVHRLGRLHGNADAMSRRPYRQCGNNGENKTAVQIRAMNFTAIGDGDRWSKKEISEAIEKDADRGAAFEGSVMTEVCRLLEIEKIRTTSYKPSTNGALERVHRTMNTMLGKIVSENQRDWDSHIAYVLAAYNATEHSATGYTLNMMAYGREMRFPNQFMYTDLGDEEAITTSSVELVAERQMLFRKAFTLARETLGIAAERSKKRYDMQVKPISYKVGDWMYYFCPRHRVGRSPKWQQISSGPYLITKNLGSLNLRLQKSAKANKVVVHVDKVKQCTGTTPASWLGTDNYNIVPATLHPDLLTNLFGGVDRTGLLSSTDDMNTTVLVRPKKNAGVPARFQCRIYASYDDESLNICNTVRGYSDNNSKLCLSRYSVMKSSTKKTDFEYRCFPCLKQDDKARSYTQSYDLVLHIVNTHRKFPIDAKHNAYYAADRSDLRNATKEVIEKYRLAALHKQRKPDADSAWGKSESSTSMACENKQDTGRPRKRDERQRGKESDREKDRDRGSRNREAEGKDSRPSSRDARKEKDRSSAERRRTDGKKSKGIKEKESRSYKQKEKRQSEYTGLDEADEDERDRRNMEEIKRRMKGRKAAKKMELSRTTKKKVKTSSREPLSTPAKETIKTADTSKDGEEKTIGTRRVPKKTGRTASELMMADVAQREDALQWASERL